MNVCLIGKRGERLDEGTKNFGVQLSRRLPERGVDTTHLDVRGMGIAELWRAVARIDPDVVHLIPGPSATELAFLRVVSLLTGCESIATATQPFLDRAPRPLLRHLEPSLVYVQSSEDRSRFDALDYSTEFLPSGVDLDRFSPVDADERRRLRDELGLPTAERVFLHVGHFERGRGIDSLRTLQEHGHVVVVGSPSTRPERDLIESLRTDGVTVRTEYVPDIEKYYQAADVYAFPVRNGEHSIQTPLSVLEAMACNRPVVSTRFGGLTDLFDEGEGLRFVRSFADLEASDLAFDRVDTRAKVSDYSWDAVVEQVIDTYERLCNGTHG